MRKTEKNEQKNPMTAITPSAPIEKFRDEVKSLNFTVAVDGLVMTERNLKKRRKKKEEKTFRGRT